MVCEKWGVFNLKQKRNAIASLNLLYKKSKEMNKEFIEKVARVQNELNVGKGRYNDFGKYFFRNAEDILVEAKPLLAKEGLVLYLTDDIKQIGERFYLCATAVLTDGADEIRNTALAREPLTKKGMDECQVTGSASSYARKYALCGIFLIDGTGDDSDSTNNGQQQPQKQIPQGQADAYQKMLADLPNIKAEISKATTEDKLVQIWNSYALLRNVEEFVNAVKAQSSKIKNAKK